jgi:putative tryptophan/tyrosine transport system substrate-binding protein
MVTLLGILGDTAMMHRAIGLLMTLALLVVPLAVTAPAPAKVPRIGMLMPNRPPSDPTPRLEAFRQGLRELGWVEGQNLAIEYRWAEEKLDRLPELAADLVQLPVDILIAVGPFGARAAQQATATLPIVVLLVGDAVGLRLVESLARPGGNITGLSERYSEMGPKWLELLKETAPEAVRVAVLVVPPLWPVQGKSWNAIQKAADALGVRLQRMEVRAADEFESAFAAMTKMHADALLVLRHPLFYQHRTRLAKLALAHQLPTMHERREYVEEGGLMAYGVSVRENYRRAATFVDKLLKGAKPADLPVEQPMKFELVINLKTAEALGLTIPRLILFQADVVIR